MFFYPQLQIFRFKASWDSCRDNWIVAITTVAQYQTAANGAVLTPICKNPVIGGQVTGVLTSLWSLAGNPPAGTIPAAPATCTSATPGALSFVNPVGGVSTYITSLTFNGGGQPALGSMMAYDRLQHMGGLSGTSLLAQTVGLVVPGGRGAFSDLSNVEWYVECYSQLGTTSVTLTISYTNTSSVSGQIVTITIPASLRVGNMLRIVPTISGDIIQSIDSCQLSGSTGGVGNFGFTNLIRLSVVNSVFGFKTKASNAFQTGLPVVINNACIAFAYIWGGGGSIPNFASIGLGIG